MYIRCVRLNRYVYVCRTALLTRNLDKQCQDLSTTMTPPSIHRTPYRSEIESLACVPKVDNPASERSVTRDLSCLSLSLAFPIRFPPRSRTVSTVVSDSPPHLASGSEVEPLMALALALALICAHYVLCICY